MARRGRKRLFTDQQLRELHKQGLNDREKGEKLGADRSIVSYRRRKLGLKAQIPRRLFTDQQLIELHEQGLNDRKKGEKLGADDSTVCHHRRRLGLEPVRKNYLRPGARRFTDEQLIELLEKGYNDRQIGNKLGATRHTVCHHRRRLGLEPHSPRRRFTDEELIELHKQGLSDREIGEKLNERKNVVRYHRIKLGLTIARELKP